MEVGLSDFRLDNAWYTEDRSPVEGTIRFLLKKGKPQVLATYHVLRLPA